MTMITFKLNGKTVQGEEKQYILQVARKYGVEIPTLCYHKALEPAGMCRLCTVEVFDGRRSRFVTSCNYPIWEGMEVRTDTDAVHEGRKLIVELLLARCPEVPLLKNLAKKYGIQEPRFRKENDDCILCGLCTRICERMGNGAISLTGRGTQMKVGTPFHVQTEFCMGCGACVSVCPTGHIRLEHIAKHAIKRIPSEYDMGLKGRKPIYVPYAQAIPNTPAIDRSQCVHFKTGGCKICTEFCAVGAIDHTQQDEIVELDVGAIILAPGFTPFDPSRYETYRYGDSPNVVTSLEFERILSPTGPYEGHIRRPSDGESPRKIAWLQCVGSRDINRCDHVYCSAVCCMYAVKEAIVAKEHAKSDLDCTIFFMDMRTHGKDFEKYYDDAREKKGIRFIRSRVHTIDPIEKTGGLLLKYADEGGLYKEEAYDMVVLSVGMEAGPEVIRLAERLGVDLSEDGFCRTNPFHPVHTTREGIYVCGAFQGPKDIPQSVMEASAGACAAGIDLQAARGTLAKIKVIPDELDVAGAEPRIGVFICNCGTNIGGVIDVPALAQYASTLPAVVDVEQNLFTCAQDTQERMKAIIKEKQLNRVIVAACTPRTHEALFQETLQSCGLNRYLFEMANIRNQDTWVHGDDPGAALSKAKDLLRMAAARAALLSPLRAKRISVNKRALVVGGGIAGMTAALSLADQGFETVIVEKEAQLGGLARELTLTIEGSSIPEYILELTDRVTRHEKIQVLTESLIVGFGGFKGNFTTELMIAPGMYERKIDHGVLVLATGAEEYHPTEYLYGQDGRIMTQIEFGKLLEARGAEGLHHVAMIQCVGSRNEEYQNCSRICCQNAVKNALHIKELNPEAEVSILYRDIRTYGTLERYYRDARKAGVHFFRFEKDEPPRVESAEDALHVSFRDLVLQRDLLIRPDLLVLSAGMRAADTEELASILKVARNQEGFFQEAHVKLRPVDLANEGIYVCGTAHGPKLITETVAQAMAAASRASTFLSQSEITLSVVTAKVDQEQCASCLICVRACPYSVPRINKEGVSEIDEALCRGCGTCAAECPAKAIQLNWYEDDQVMSKVNALLEGRLA